VARWSRTQNWSRIRLSGSYRLSTALAIGWSFRSAAGFEIEISTRDGAWLTDDRQPAGVSTIHPVISGAKRLVESNLIISVGVDRDPSVDVAAALGLKGDADLLVTNLAQPLANGAEAQACVQAIKAAISENVGRLGPRQLNLYVAGPAAFAVALGHRWNAFPPTQLHEFVASERRYVPTARLGYP
jgi:hypothetical protein